MKKTITIILLLLLCLPLLNAQVRGIKVPRIEGKISKIKSGIEIPQVRPVVTPNVGRGWIDLRNFDHNVLPPSSLKPFLGSPYDLPVSLERHGLDIQTHLSILQHHPSLLRECQILTSSLEREANLLKSRAFEVSGLECENDNGCPLTAYEEIVWVGRRLSKYGTCISLYKLVAEDFETFAPNHRTLSAEDGSLIVNIPATPGVIAPPIVFESQCEAGGAATLVKLLCSIQTKNLIHGELYIVVSDSNIIEREFQKRGNCVSVLILRDKLSQMDATGDIELFYRREIPADIICVVRQCEKIIENSVTGISPSSIGPVLPSLFPSATNPLMNRIVNYLASDNVYTLKKRLNDDIHSLEGEVDFVQLPNGDILMHLSVGDSYFCQRVTPIVFLSRINPTVETVENPEQHIDKNVKRLGIIKSDGQGCLGLNTRVGTVVAMELMQLFDADTTRFYDYYVYLSYSNQSGLEMDIKTVFDDADTVILINDSVNIKKDPTLSVVSLPFSSRIKHANTARESIYVKSLKQDIIRLLNGTKEHVR